MRQSVKIFIVGAGPAGISTWLHLNSLAPELAADTLLIDAAHFPREKVCAGGITPDGIACLSSIGVPIESRSLGLRDVNVSYGRRRLEWRGGSPIQIVDRMEFDYMLVKAALARGARLREGERFLSCHQSGNSVKVSPVVEITRY